MDVWVSLGSADVRPRDLRLRMGIIGPQYGLVDMPMHFHCVLQCSKMLFAAEQKNTGVNDAHRGTNKLVFFSPAERTLCET